MSFCTLALAFLFLLCGLPLPIPPLNRIFSFSDPVSFKEINYLPLRIRLFLNATRRTQKLTVILNTVQLFFRTSCFFKSQNVMANGYYGIETLYQT